uniref:Xrn1 helical domain-containing protein n=1 Tax=Plectus sambesii TaxID=2011161 RepID=A0A914UXV0_9BILA
MGVPAFFRWLSRKYPSIVVNAVEEKPHSIDDTTVPVDCTKPNPNGIEFDLEIREGAIDRLIRLYKDAVYKTHGYLTQDGHVNLERVQLILSQLGEAEDEIFKKRQENELNFRARNKAKKARERAHTAPAWIPANQFGAMPVRGGGRGGGGGRQADMSGAESRVIARDMRMEAMQRADSEETKLQSMLKPAEEKGSGNGYNATGGRKRPHDQSSVGANKPADESDEEPVDDVRLWEDGWKERYYQAKFEVSADDYEFRKKVAHAYVEGLCWVLRYYYQGCASWEWFFPFHYAPFASDLDNVADVKIDFSRTTMPFKPLEQLMGVFPAASRKHIPSTWHHLMTEIESPIIDFYPYGRGGQGQYQQTPAAYGQQQQPRNTYQQQGQPSGQYRQQPDRQGGPPQPFRRPAASDYF